MRLVTLLIALLIVGYFIYKQIGPGSNQQPETVQAISGSNIPKAPRNPRELKQFDAQMNQYMKKEAEKRAAALKDAELQ